MSRREYLREYFRTHHPDGPSRLARRVFCPRSYHLERRAPPEPPNADASKGIMLHEATLTHDPRSALKVPEEDKWLVFKADDYLRSKCDLFRGDHEGFEIEEGYEIRVEVPDLYYGWLDHMIWAKKKAALINELKFGMGNYSQRFIYYQGLGYSLPILLGKEEYGVEYVDFCCFHVHSGTELVERFEASAADALLIEVEGIIEMAKDESSQAHPSEEACRYCRAKSICEAFQSEIRAPVPAGPESQAIWSTKDWERALELASKVNLWEKWAAQVRARAKEMMTKGELTLSGWSVGNRYVREVVDVQNAYQALSGVITQSEFLKACEVPVGKLEGVFVDKLVKKIGGTKKAARDQFTETLTGNRSMVVNLQTFLKKEQQ